VWGEDVPPSAANLVATYVARLRRVLEPERVRRAAGTVLMSVGTGYELRVRPDQVDVWLFEQLVAQGDLGRALALWRGRPLDGIPGPFAAAERERLTDRRLTVLERRIEDGLARGEDWTSELRTHIHANPYRERLRALLMTALHRNGRQSDALNVYHTARRTLAADLGVEPGIELRRAHERVLGPRTEADLARQYLAGVRNADRLLRPGRTIAEDPEGPRFATHQDASAWLEHERRAIVEAGVASPDPMAAASLATDLRAFTHRRGYWTDQRRLAAAAVRQDHDHAAALGYLELGGVDYLRRRMGQAEAHVRHALALFRLLDDVAGTSRALNGLSMIRAELGDHTEAWALADENLALPRDPNGRSVALDNLALVELRRGRFDEAVDYCERSIAIQREIGSPILASAALNLLGFAHVGRGEHDSAIRCQRRSTQLARQVGNRHREALALSGLATAYRAKGDERQAVAIGRRADHLLGMLG
jgi:DNA-binding SARP family transcriptional activator